MKKRSVIVGILLVVLLFVFAPSAHAGVGNTDSGGSSLIDSGGGSSWSDSGSSWSGGGSSWSDGGSSWSGGSSSYSSGSGTDSGGVVAIFAIVGLIGFIYNIAKEANDSDESFSSNSGPKLTTEERAGRPIENNYEAIRRIRKLDPMFDEDRFLSQVKLG